jgi:hypothetical protein
MLVCVPNLHKHKRNQSVFRKWTKVHLAGRVRYRRMTAREWGVRGPHLIEINSVDECSLHELVLRGNRPMRRAAERRIAVGGILQIFAPGGGASLLWQEAYTTVSVRRLYLSGGPMPATTEVLHWRAFNPGRAIGEKGIRWQRVPPGFQP